MKNLLAHKAVRNASAGVAALAATVGLSLAGAAPAQAASDISSCKLSANWTVKVSVTFDRVDSDHQTTRYIVVNSPGALSKFRLNIFQGGVAERLWGPYVATNPAKVQRVNTTVTGHALLVDAEFWGGTGYCSTVVHLA